MLQFFLALPLRTAKLVLMGFFFFQIFKKAVRNCLEECAKRHFSSIAFPALGTGNYGFPGNVAAKLMINEAVQFLTTYKNCPISTIYFVAYSDDDFRTFQNELKHYKYDSTAAEASNVLPPTLSDERRKDSTFCIGGLIVEVVHGDITDEQTNVIVNSTNRYMFLSSTAVGSALLRKAGSQLQLNCDKYTKHGALLEIGSIINTPACGELKCKTVFHIIPQQENLEMAILVCLRKAEELGHVSISFPALDTGHHASSPERTAGAMIEAIKKFCNTPVYLKFIRIVIIQAEMYKSYLDVFNHSGFSAISDTKILQPADNGPEVTTGNLETACFSIYGESPQSVESAAQELKKVTNTTPSSGFGESFPPHLQGPENHQGNICNNHFMHGHIICSLQI